jgi:hypothetical protein
MWDQDIFSVPEFCYLDWNFVYASVILFVYSENIFLYPLVIYIHIFQNLLFTAL